MKQILISFGTDTDGQADINEFYSVCPDQALEALADDEEKTEQLIVGRNKRDDVDDSMKIHQDLH